MASFRIRTKIDGEALVLSELISMVGKIVHIEATERPDDSPSADRWTEAAEAVKAIPDYDFEACPSNGTSMRHAAATACDDAYRYDLPRGVLMLWMMLAQPSPPA